MKNTLKRSTALTILIATVSFAEASDTKSSNAKMCHSQSDCCKDMKHGEMNPKLKEKEKSDSSWRSNRPLVGEKRSI